MVNGTDNINLAHKIILELIPEKSIVLDLGCGSGELLKSLRVLKNVNGRGVEINEDRVIECLRKGLSVFQGNIDEGLKEYPDKSYDYVILNQTLQSIHNITLVLSEIVRVGRNAIVGVPNFAHWRIRGSLALKGVFPVTYDFHYDWYNTPAIRLVTIKHFKNICRKMNIAIAKQIFITGTNTLPFPLNCFPNLFSENALFVLKEL